MASPFTKKQSTQKLVVNTRSLPTEPMYLKKKAVIEKHNVSEMKFPLKVKSRSSSMGTATLEPDKARTKMMKPHLPNESQQKTTNAKTLVYQTVSRPALSGGINATELIDGTQRVSADRNPERTTQRAPAAENGESNVKPSPNNPVQETDKPDVGTAPQKADGADKQSFKTAPHVVEETNKHTAKTAPQSTTKEAKMKEDQGTTFLTGDGMSLDGLSLLEHSKDLSLSQASSERSRETQQDSVSTGLSQIRTLGSLSSSVDSHGIRTVLDIASVETATTLVADSSGAPTPRPCGRFSDTSEIEEKINIDTLETLKHAFASADVNRSGDLELEEFKLLLKKQLHLSPNREQQIDALFMKIDWSSVGSITWDEFCTYMQLEYAEKEDSYLRAKEVAFHTPARIENIPHRDPVLRITDTSDGTFVACSQEGLVTFWSANTELKRTRSVVNTENTGRTKPKWITDFVIMNQFNKIIVGTGDREIQFFELSSFEPYCQISGLETVPLKLDYSSTGFDECLILYGDTQGCINIFVIKSAGECLRLWKKMPKQDGFIASISLDAVANGPNVQFIRWQVHGDWVQQIKYYHDIGQVISCSNNPNTALVIGCTIGSTHVEQQLKELRDLGGGERSRPKQFYAYNNTKTRLEADQTVFKVYKGVKCFDFSKDKNIIVTGGMDRIIRLWNPYVSQKPTAMLRGHNAPIFFLHIADEDDRIYSLSTDRCLKVWDIQDHTCLLTIRPKSHKIRGDLQAVHYSPVSKAIAVATDQMAVLCLRHKAALHADMVISHKDPVTCCKYNPSFKQVVTCCSGSVVKLWDFETGAPIFEYGEAHDEAAITCMTFDNTGRRLITGGRDGILKIWNYNNGHCLRVLKKEEKSEFPEQQKGKEREVCDLTYVEMNKNRYVISVGWDRRINIYYDSLSDSNIHHVQHPTPYWADDERDGHKEDVLAVAHCLPNLLATASYDGEVIVWNMVSGHIFCHLRPQPPEGYSDQSLDGDLGISKLLFLKTRAYKKDAGSLVASGPRAHIHIWNVFQGGRLMAQFPGSKMPGGVVSAMATNKANTMLYTADSLGFIYVWDVAKYCLEAPETESPDVLLSWRGHVESVSCIDLVEQSKVLLTSAADCTVRLWTVEGHYIGTFGQPELWDIYNPVTFQHPMVPYDVLVDPMSMPSHPVIAEKQSTHQVLHQEASKDGEEKTEKRTPTPPTHFGSKPQFYIDDDQIAAMLKQRPFDKATGKRLRHEKNKKVKVEWSGPSEYQMLHCYDLADTPQPTPPQLKVNKDDPFDFYID